MILFGYLADCFGRKRLYGVELGIVIAATLGLTQASAGYGDSMQIYPWIVFWRTMLGVGVGAEYPLSALIASEWSSTEYRGTMLAAVFLMQPLAQLTAQGIGLGALRGMGRDRHPDLFNETDHAKAAPIIDAIWRLVIGVGAIPAILAIIGRLTIPETPRFLLEIERDASGALESTAEVYSGPKANEAKLSAATIAKADDTEPEEKTPDDKLDEDAGPSNGESSNHKEFYGPTRASTEQILKEDNHNRTDTTGQHSGNSGEGNSPKRKETFVEWWGRNWGTVKMFMRSKYGPILFATSFCWFILDICFYGLGLDNPQLLGKIWLASDPDKGSSNRTNHEWNSNTMVHNGAQPIYQVLEGNFVRALLTVAPASIAGSLFFLVLAKRVPRVRFMVCIFIILAILFAILGGSLFKVYETSDHAVTVVFYAISLFLINLGPNTITFMLPAELFETKNRGTCYGIAAASGKLGAIIIQIVIWKIGASGPDKEPLASLLLVFAPLMLIGALTAYIWIPEVQDPVINKVGHVIEFSKFKNRALEDIAEDPTRDQIVGLVNKVRHVLHLDQ
jgi:PHS family inorganic phosphate transporter-like MFS transporter